MLDKKPALNIHLQLSYLGISIAGDKDDLYFLPYSPSPLFRGRKVRAWEAKRDEIGPIEHWDAHPILRHRTLFGRG